MDVYDPIHGNIFIDPLAKAIVDTPEFQRLRNIKQLGCCYYVFPGACHNRFEHSLGVYHLTKEYIQILESKKDDISLLERTLAIFPSKCEDYACVSGTRARLQVPVSTLSHPINRILEGVVEDMISNFFDYPMKQ